jgi:ubiquinone/menaquinone biosynthesis C-methylase UbiE
MLDWYQKKVVPRLLNKEMGKEEFEAIRREVLADASGVVLEIGVGPGYNLALYTNVTKLYALEPSQELVDIAKGRAQNLSFPVEFLTAGAEKIPLADSSVDTVVSTWVMCSVNDPAKVLKEIRRVLKPEGKFVFVEHGASHNGFWHTIQRILTPITKHFTGNCHYDRKMVTLIEGAGFTIQNLSHPKEKFRPLIHNYQGVAVLK